MRSDYRVYRYDRLDAPVVTAGSAAVLIGAQNGLFPDMGYRRSGRDGQPLGRRKERSATAFWPLTTCR